MGLIVGLCDFVAKRKPKVSDLMQSWDPRPN